MATFIESSSLSKEISHRAKQVLTDGQTDRQTNRRPENIMLRLLISSEA